MPPTSRRLVIQPCRQPALDRLQLVCISCGEGPHVLALEAAAIASLRGGVTARASSACRKASAPRSRHRVWWTAAWHAQPPPPHPPGRTRARRLHLLRAALSGSGRLDTLRGRDWLTGQSASASGAHASRLQSRRFRRLWPFRRRARSWGDNQRRRARAAAGGRERRRPLLAGVGAQPSVSGWVGRVCARAAQPGSGPRREHGRGRGRRGRQWRGRRRAVVAAVAGTAGQ